jgi:hypothetical protein
MSDIDTYRLDAALTALGEQLALTGTRPISW